MPYAEVEPDEVKARLARGEDVFLLDVREPDEVEAWAYPIGVNIPLGQLGDRLDELPRDATIVVACHVGGRSAAAAQALSDAGWTAENLTGARSPGRPGSPRRKQRCVKGSATSKRQRGNGFAMWHRVPSTAVAAASPTNERGAYESNSRSVVSSIPGDGAQRLEAARTGPCCSTSQRSCASTPVGARASPGISWSVVPSPATPPTQYNYLIGVSCTSSTFCAAVGTLNEMWNGSAWSVVPRPTHAERPQRSVV